MYSVEKVSKHVYRIKMPYVCSYLIVGRHEAILIDSGFGYGDIKEVIETITDLPVTLLLSHGHPDHNGAANQFDDVYLHEKDFEMNAISNRVSVRQQVWKYTVSEDYELRQELWQPARKRPYTPYKKGMSFDIGDLTILPFHIPGHSKGSMIFIIPEEKIAIFGDAISHPMVMFLETSAKVKVHYEAMLRLKPYSDLYDRVLVNHETYELNKIVLDNNIQAAKDILNGVDVKDSPSERTQSYLKDATIYLARKRYPWLPDDPEKIGNIYYSKHQL